MLSGVAWFANALEAAEGADVVVVLTEWNEFRALDLKHLREAMRGDVLVDLRNVYPPVLAEATGFVYRGVGRGSQRGIESAAVTSNPPPQPEAEPVAQLR